jgi:hypothetical protein
MTNSDNLKELWAKRATLTLWHPTSMAIQEQLKRGLGSSEVCQKIFPSDNQREHTNKKWKHQGLQVYHKSWEGKELNMQQNSRCLLYWTKPDGSQCTVELYVPTFASPTLSDQDRSRFVHFTANGIDIRNASGTVVRKAGVVAGPTVSRGEMQLRTNSDNLLALWTVQTGYVAPAESTGPTVDLYGAKGVSLIRPATKITTLEEGYPKPPNRGDAVWNFNEFPITRCPMVARW